MERRTSMSTPAVGSSRISSFGSWMSARAIMSRRFMPPDSEREIASRFSHSCSLRSHTSMRSFATLRGMP